MYMFVFLREYCLLKKLKIKISEIRPQNTKYLSTRLLTNGWCRLVFASKLSENHPA